jgi:hypothetical protein
VRRPHLGDTSPRDHRFRLRVRLDPRPEDRPVLQLYPAQPLWPDFVVVAAGSIALELAGRPICYRDGKLLPADALPPTDQDSLELPEARIGDYVALFLLRLLEATIQIARGTGSGEQLACFGDNPACLALCRSGDRVRVAYRESPRGPDVAAAYPIERDLRATIAAAVDDYVAQLLSLNPALASQPDVTSLRAGQHQLEE